MYFNKFPTIAYDFLIDGQTEVRTIKDITLNVRIRKDLLSNITLYDYYDIIDGDTPEIISTKFYGTPQYHWIVMLANDRYNYIEDFPMTHEDLVEVITLKYGGELYYPKHYESNITGLVVPAGTPDSTVITNYEYELRKNEEKRRIKIISESLIPQILTQFDMRI